jgi:hypothetical protein
MPNFPFNYLFTFQAGVPAFVAPQPEDAMAVLQKKAADLDVSKTLKIM